MVVMFIRVRNEFEGLLNFYLWKCLELSEIIIKRDWK